MSSFNRKDAKTQRNRHEITGLILSAGLSERMGEFKPLVNFNGKSFIENIAGKLSGICKEIVVVTGYNACQIEEHIYEWEEKLKNKIKLVHNTNFKEGMFTSLKAGTENCNSRWILYHFVDQPFIPQRFYFEFIDEINSKYDWIQPSFNNKKGHPVIFGEKIKNEIRLNYENKNLKYISNLKGIIKKYWTCNYPEVLYDIDTKEDLNNLKKKTL